MSEINDIAQAYECISAFLSNRISISEYEELEEYDMYLRKTLGLDEVI